MNKLYSNIKPVKVDSAGSKHSKEMVDLAAGPRSQQQLQQQTKGWLDTFSQWVSGSSKKQATQGNSTDSGKPDKVSRMSCGKDRQMPVLFLCAFSVGC